MAVAFDWLHRVASQAATEPFAVGLARDDATTWLLRGAGLPEFDFETGQAFLTNPRTCASSPAPCVLVRANGLRFSARSAE